MRRQGFAIWLLAPSLLLAQSERGVEPPPDAVGLSLTDALRIAIESNTDVKTAVLGMPKAREDWIQAESVFDPTFSGAMNYTNSRQPFYSSNPFSGLTIGELSVSQSENLFFSGSFSKAWAIGLTSELTYTNTRLQTENIFSLNPSYTPEVEISLRQPLLKGACLDKNLEGERLAEIGWEVARLESVRQALETASSVEKAYLELLYAYENVRVNRKALAVAQASLEETMDLIRYGYQMKADTVQVQSFVAEAEARLRVARFQLLDTRDALLAVLQNRPEAKDWNVSIWPVDGPADLPIPERLSEDEALATAFASRPDYLQAKLDVKSKEVSLRARDNETLPQLDLIGKWSWSGLGNTMNNSHDALDDGRFYDLTLGVELAYPILNRQANSAYREAQLDLEISERNLYALEQAILYEVRTALRGVLTAQANLDATRAAKRRSEADLDLRRSRVKAGYDTPLEIQKAEETVVRAEGSVMRAVVDMHKANTELERVLGTLLDARGIKVILPTPSMDLP